MSKMLVSTNLSLSGEWVLILPIGNIRPGSLLGHGRVAGGVGVELFSVFGSLLV